MPNARRGQIYGRKPLRGHLIGGIEYAFDKAGWETLWQVEWDKKCTSVLSKHWPYILRCGDIREVDPLRDLLSVDVICGGFPCQGLSVAGKRKGLADERSGLFFEFVRIVAALRPQWVLVENVPGLLSSAGGRDFGAVLGSLDELGYGLAWRILDAQNFGVAQRRRRVFIVGHLGDGSRASQVLFEPEGGFGNPSEGGEAGSGTASGPEGRAGGRRKGVLAESGVVQAISPIRGGPDDNDAQAGHLVPEAYQCHGGNVGSMEALRKGDGGLTSSVPFVAHTLKAEGTDASEDGTGQRVPMVVEETVGTLAPNTGPKGHDAGNFMSNQAVDAGYIVPAEGHPDPAHALSVPTSDRRYDPNGETYVVEGVHAVAFVASERMNSYSKEREQSFTLNSTPPSDTSNLQYGIRQGMVVRRLTPRECSRLQAFPDDWCAFGADGKPITDGPQYRMYGNAVCTSVVWWIARRMLAVHEGRDPDAEEIDIAGYIRSLNAPMMSEERIRAGK